MLSAPVALRRARPAAAAAPAPPPRTVVNAAELPVDAARALLARYDRAGPRYTSYPPVPAWRSVDGPEYARWLTAAAATRQPLAMYVHLPFCAAQCLYCGCNAAVTHRRDVIDAYLARLAREADRVAAALGPGQRVTRLHWGGGTPNHLDDEQLERAWAIVADRFDLVPDAELSLEADPRLATAAQLRTLAQLGFRRVSYGVQDLDRDVQLAIGRRQPEPAVRMAVDAARDAGFTGVHVDLIYGLPLQTVDGFTRTAETVLALAPDRVACFGYAHVPWMRPHQRRIDAAALPDGADRLALFAAAASVFTGAGYVWAGMDHFAAPGDPLARAAASGTLQRDFMGYTAGRDGAVGGGPAHLVGLGLSAIGELGAIEGAPHGAYVQHAARLGDWQRLVDGGTLPATRGHVRTADEHRRAAVIQALLCRLEVRAADADALLAEGPSDARAGFARVVADGLVARRGATWQVTPLGRLFVRSVCMLFDTATAPPDGAPPRYSRTV